MVELLIGNIASGKSTYAKKRVQDGWFCLCDDNLIHMILADQYSLYKRAYQPLVASLMLRCAEELLARNVKFVVDSALNADHYSQWYALFRDVEVKEVVFERCDPSVHAARRMAHDPRGGTYEMWLEVAQRIDASLQQFESKNISL